MSGTTDGFAEAERRIAAEAEQRTGRLDLRNLGLERLPEGLFALTHLRELDLGAEMTNDAKPNCIQSQYTRLSVFSNLVTLDLTRTDISDLEPVAAIRELQTLRCGMSAVADLSPLASVQRLRSLDCEETQVYDLQPLARLTALTSLNLAYTRVRDLTPTSDIAALEVLDLSESGVDDLSPLARLAALSHLELLDTRVSDLGPLTGLSRLTKLGVMRTGVEDLWPLSRLPLLAELTAAETAVADLAPLARLQSLTKLRLEGTPISSLRHLANLTALTALELGHTRIDEVSVLRRLVRLDRLSLSFTAVSTLAPLAELRRLISLSVSDMPISNLRPIESLLNLEYLDLSNTPVQNLEPLHRLVALKILHLRGTRVDNLTPLASLSRLRHLNLSQTKIHNIGPLVKLQNLDSLDLSENSLDFFPDALLYHPNLRHLWLHQSVISNVPNSVLSSSRYQNCLYELRAHYADQAKDVAPYADLKLLVLGNGKVGKTQLCRQLRGEPFQTEWNSTHGVAIRTATLPSTDGHSEIHLQLWDFGGQDIFHGTHALFLPNAGACLIAWSTDTNNADTYELSGLRFRNHPLPYWIAHVRHQARSESPVLIVQTHCDRPQDERRKLPIPAAEDEALPIHWKMLHVSSKPPARGLGGLRDALRDAATWLQDPTRGGVARIGRGRLAVIRTLEEMREADARRPPSERQHRLLTQEAFLDLCKTAGDISSPLALLEFLHRSGIVYHQRDLFADRIVLDQGWMLDAIYAVFERGSAYRRITRQDGRFYPSDLAELVWQQHVPQDHALFLGMMRESGICFVHRRARDAEDEDQYIAPDLLPGREAISERLEARWPGSNPGLLEEIPYDFLRGALIRALIARVGDAAGIDALYWRDGVTAYDSWTRSHLRIEQAMDGQWQGRILLRTRSGDAANLMAQLLSWVEEEQRRFGLMPRAWPAPRDDRQRRAATTILGEADSTSSPVSPAIVPAPSEKPIWFVSYAWGDDTPEGRLREAAVDAFCAAAARSAEVERDNRSMRLGDSIAAFTRRAGLRGRVPMFISAKYLRSPPCMVELFEVWRAAGSDPERFRQRARPLLLPDAGLTQRDTRDAVVAHWEAWVAAEQARVERPQGALRTSEGDFVFFKRIHRFHQHIPDILHTLADMLHVRPKVDATTGAIDPADIERLVTWCAEDSPPP